MCRCYLPMRVHHRQARPVSWRKSGNDPSSGNSGFRSMGRIQYDVRPYSDEDEQGVRELLLRSLGAGPAGERSPEFFWWKHHENPFGRSLMIVAEKDGEIIGLRAFMRWEFCTAERNYRAVRAVDTATDPRFQGQGIFTRLTLEAIDHLGSEADFIFNTPNNKSMPGYLKMGWKEVGRVPIHVRLTRPFALAKHVLFPPRDLRQGGEEAGAALLEWTGDLSYGGEGRLATAKSRAFLDWRYGRAPSLKYRAVRENDNIAFFRVRRRGRLLEATIADMIARSNQATVSLLRRVRSAASADYVATHFPAGLAPSAARGRAGFVRVPVGPLLVTRALKAKVEPDPARLDSWSLSLGDLEVF